mgnify:CR=1 FL=1
MDMSPTYVGYKFRSLALANCPTNSNLSSREGASSKMVMIFLLLTKSLGHTRGAKIGAPEKILDNWLKCVRIKL